MAGSVDVMPAVRIEVNHESFTDCMESSLLWLTRLVGIPAIRDRTEWAIALYGICGFRYKRPVPRVELLACFDNLWNFLVQTQLVPAPERMAQVKHEESLSSLVPGLDFDINTSFRPASPMSSAVIMDLSLTMWMRDQLLYTWHLTEKYHRGKRESGHSEIRTSNPLVLAVLLWTSDPKIAVCIASYYIPSLPLLNVVEL